MSYALVGSLGTVAKGSSGVALTPGWGTSETRAANNLLILWVLTVGGSTTPATPTGWTLAKTATPAAATGTTIFYKIAAGGDAAPTVGAQASTTYWAMLGEFSGNATASPLDQTAAGSGTTGTDTATAASVDAAAGELVVYCSLTFYTTSATKALANALNNGATAQSTNNNTDSTTLSHYDLGFGITTGNGSADSDSFTYPTTKLSSTSVIIASFKLAAAAPVTPIPSPVVSVAVTRSSVY